MYLPLCHITNSVSVRQLWQLSSLWTCRTVEKGLRLCSRHARIAEKPSGRPAEPSRDQLGPGTLTPLNDHQNPDDEPEEEVDPHGRLRGSGHMNHTFSTHD